MAVFANEARFTHLGVFPVCSLQDDVGDPPFFKFLSALTHHLSIVKFSEKKIYICYKMLPRFVVETWAAFSSDIVKLFRHDISSIDVLFTIYSLQQLRQKQLKWYCLEIGQNKKNVSQFCFIELARLCSPCSLSPIARRLKIITVFVNTAGRVFKFCFY